MDQANCHIPPLKFTDFFSDIMTDISLNFTHCVKGTTPPTDHHSSSFWVDGQELSGNDAPAAALPKCFLVNFLKLIFGRMVLQDDYAAAVASHNDVICRNKHRSHSYTHTAAPSLAGEPTTALLGLNDNTLLCGWFY